MNVSSATAIHRSGPARFRNGRAPGPARARPRRRARGTGLPPIPSSPGSRPRQDAPAMCEADDEEKAPSLEVMSMRRAFTATAALALPIALAGAPTVAASDGASATVRAASTLTAHQLKNPTNLVTHGPDDVCNYTKSRPSLQQGATGPHGPTGSVLSESGHRRKHGRRRRLWPASRSPQQRTFSSVPISSSTGASEPKLGRSYPSGPTPQELRSVDGTRWGGPEMEKSPCVPNVVPLGLVQHYSRQR